MLVNTAPVFFLPSLRHADTKLADKIGSLQAQAGEAQPVSSPRASPNLGEKNPKQISKQITIGKSSIDAASKIRQELSEAQRSRGILEAKLQSTTDELQKLKIASNLESQRVSDLNRERDQLVRRVKDRDEEIRGKTKLLDDVHDENLSLTLQLNMADERSQKLETENKQLVERWMKRMGEEADQMNEKSKFS